MKNYVFVKRFNSFSLATDCISLFVPLLWSFSVRNCDLFLQNTRSCSLVHPELFQSFPYLPQCNWGLLLSFGTSYQYCVRILSGKLSSFLLNFGLFLMKNAKLRRLDISKRKKKDISTKVQQKLLRKQERRRLSSDAMTKLEHVASNSSTK